MRKGEESEGRPFRRRFDDDRAIRSRADDGAGKPFRQRAGGDKPDRFRSAEGDRRVRPRAARADGTGRDEADEKPIRARGRPPFEKRPAARPEFGQTAVESEAPQRVAKVMARAGLCSRRDAETWIEAGRVCVNGEILQSPARDVGPRDVVTVDGAAIPTRERTRLFLHHKRRGLITTARDPEGRPTVFDNLPRDLPRLISVGRLDYNTEGLLLLTNDGGLARALELPDTGWLRRYRVRAFGETTQDRLDALREGVSIEGIHYGPVEARLDRRQGDNVWLTLGLREGKNREVKRILDHLGLDVNRLIRLSFGPFQLGDLKEGAVEEVRTRVLADQLGPELAAEAGVDFDAPIFVHEAEDEPRVQEPRHLARSSEEPREIERPIRQKRRSRLEPVTSVWRADADNLGLKRRAPGRRDVDPRFARQESAAREHRRGGHVETRGGRRVLVEKLVPDASAEAGPAKAKGQRDRRSGERPAEDRSAEDRPAEERPVMARADRPGRPFPKRADLRGERAAGGRLGREPAAGRAPRSGEDKPRRFESRPDRPARDRRGENGAKGGSKREARPADAKWENSGFGKERSGPRKPRSDGFGGASRPSGFGKSRGGPQKRPGGGKPRGGGRPGAGRPPRAT